jgi:DNA-binding PadR family transcriptional regulator
LVLLALIHDSPRHGYELMSDLDRLFGPTYRASAGSVYPALTALVEEGLVAERRESARRRYLTTPTGRAALHRRRVALAAVEVRTGVRLRTGAGVAGAVDRLAARLGSLEGLVDVADVDDALEAAAESLEILARQRRDDAQTRR